MQAIIDWVAAHGLWLAGVLLFLWNELLAYNEDWKSNSLAQLIGNILKAIVGAGVSAISKKE